jgi:transposase
MYRGKERPILAYGSANINPTGKGEVTVPVKYIQRACEQKFEVFPVDEFRTSKVCYKCGELLDEVKFEGEKFPVRGLRWCKTKTCSELLDRDFNAAKNILNRYLNIGSFQLMSRDIPLPKKVGGVRLLKV